MREEEKRKGKIEKALSIGIAVLVLLMLGTQFTVFVRHLIVGQRTAAVLSGQADSLGHTDTTASGRSGDLVAGLPMGNGVTAVGGHDGRSEAASAAGGMAESRVFAPEKRTAPESVSREAAGGGRIAGAGGEKPDKMASLQSSGGENHRQYNHDGWKWDRVELNSADSASLEALPWIGPYYAQQIIRYRTKLWGSYADVSQLMDIRGIDSVLLEKLGDRIYIDPSTILKLDLYTMPEDSLAKHPYIGAYRAKGICRYRKLVTEEEFSILDLVENKILPESSARRLKLYER